jgi:nucleotide-binding universal stress UspA family protein
MIKIKTCSSVFWFDDFVAGLQSAAAKSKRQKRLSSAILFYRELIMTFATLMTHVDIAEPHDDRIRLAAGLASRFASTLIGVAAWEPRPPLMYGGVVVDTEPTESLLQEMSDRLADVGEHFRKVVGPEQPTEWRVAIDAPTEFLVREARAADLIIIGRDRPPGDLYRTLDPGATILRAGRPVLVVPNCLDSLKAERVVVCWKDKREARRAVGDSLPLIRDALSVAVVEIVEPGGEKPAQTYIDDVADYVARHHIAVTVRKPAHAFGSVAGQLISVAHETNADLIVAGGYGHSRLGEWIFGGVTQGLLAASPVCCLVSH